jgi:NADH-quinone oxidoreductase subunit H
MEISPDIRDYVVIPLIKAFVIINIMAVMAGVLTLVERRVLAWLQVRKGPNRVGFQGSLQWVADTIKLMLKEDIVPTKAERVIHFLAPVLVVVPALTVFAVIPWGPVQKWNVPGLGRFTTGLYVTDLNIGLLFVLAITSIGIYGIILGGWASNSKYALLGGLRSAAQLISYEVPMGFAVVSVVLMSRSLSLVEIIEAQRRFHVWFIFPGLLAFFLYFLSGVAETNRVPFDLPEAESELVAGFHTEYSGVKWSFFFLGEYANMITISAIATTLFFGGWLRPFPNVGALAFLDVLPPIFWFLGKISLFMLVYIWFRGTFPRYRFDQLMALGWKVLIPLALGNLVLVALFALYGRRGLQTLGGVLWGLFALALVLSFRKRKKAVLRAPAVPRAEPLPEVA